MCDAGQVVPQQVVVIRAHRLVVRLRAFLRLDSIGITCESRLVVCCVMPGCDSFAGDFAGMLFVSIDGVVFAKAARTEAFADIVVNITPVIAMITNAKTSPTHLMKYLAANRRCMHSAPMKILSAINFSAIVARRVLLSDIAYVATKTSCNIAMRHRVNSSLC